MKICILNGQPVLYTIERKKVQSIRIRLRNERIYVSAPAHCTTVQIEQVLQQHSNWILQGLAKQKQELAKLRAPLQQAAYLGNQYPIRLASADAEQQETVCLIGDTIQIICRDAENGEQQRKLLYNWYIQESIPLFEQYNQRVYDAFRELGYSVPFAKMTIRMMKSRWGSCNANTGRISMNAALMQCPKPCILSVFYHEYAHFLQQNHSAAFYQILHIVCPDYAHWRQYLKKLSPM